MTEVTVLVAARLRATLGRLKQRGRRSGAEMADQTEYASEKLAYGQMQSSIFSTLAKITAVVGHGSRSCGGSWRGWGQAWSER